MTHDLNKLIVLLNKLNSRTGVEIISAKQAADGQEQVVNLENDMRDLIKTVSDEKAIENQKQIEKTLVHIHIHIGDMLQDLQNLHEIVACAIKRFSQNYEK